MSSSNRATGATWTAVALVVALATVAWATDYTWDTAGGGSWSDLNNWKDPANDPSLAYPKSAGDKAIIKNTLPSSWPGNNQIIVVDVTDINGLDIEFRDDNPPGSSEVNFQIQQNVTINRWDWYNDTLGSGRSDMNISAGKTLSINYMNVTGRFPNHFAGGIWKWTPDGSGAATYGYFTRSDGDYLGGNMVMDFTSLTSMNWIQNSSSASPVQEARDFTCLIGNVGSDQEWTATGAGGAIRMDQRSTGGPWNWHKVGTNTVDMGKRTTGTLSNGFRITRGFNGDHGGGQKRNLFTDASGNAIGGLVKIADYAWMENSNGNVQWLQWEKLGCDTVITDGGMLALQGRNSDFDEVNMFWILPGKTLTVEGTGGHLRMDAVSGAGSTSRRGVYFEGASLILGGDLDVQGPRTFLNGGGSGGSIVVGGNVAVQSTNPAGFATISGLSGGHTAASDDFDLRASSLTMNGGGARTIDWVAGVGTGGSLDAGDFGLANFTLGSLKVTNATDLVLLDGEELFLSQDLLIDAGSTLTLGSTGAIYLLDPDLSELARVNSYLGTRLLNAHTVPVSDVGFSIEPGAPVPPIPEPASALLVLAGLGFVARRRHRA